MEKWGLRFGKLVPKVKPQDQIKTWRILRGDSVEVIDGEHKGESGRVLEVRRKENRVVVEGINMARRWYEGKMHNVEQGIQASKVALLDPQKERATKMRWGWKEDGKGGYAKVRVSKLTGVEIPKPPPPKRERKAGEFDTMPKDALAETFVPRLDIPPVPKDCIL